MTKDNFEKTIWYRLLKVVFVFIFLGGLIGISLFALNEKPVGTSYYEIRCNNGKIIKDELSSPGFRLIGEWAYHGNILCAGDELSQQNGDRKIENRPDAITILTRYGYDYVVKHGPALTTEWLYWFLILGLILVIFTLALWLVKRMFYYVAFSEGMVGKPKKLFD